MLKDKEERTIVYRIYTAATRKIEVMSEVQIEKNVEASLARDNLHCQGEKYGTVEVQFREIAAARLHSATPLQAEEVLLRPAYHGSHASRARVKNMLPEVNGSLAGGCYTSRHGGEGGGPAGHKNTLQKLIRAEPRYDGTG